MTDRINNYALSMLLILLSIPSFSQLTQSCNTEDRVLLMGDSWAQYMYDDGVYNTNFDAYGHADKTVRSDVFEVSLFSSPPNPQGSYYAVSGSLAREWTDESTFAYLQNVRTQLINQPQIKLVVISIGGNDVLAGQSNCGWYKNMNLDPDLASRGCGFTNETEFYDLLESQVSDIIDEVLAVRSDINVLISSYDYPNFNVTTSWVGCLFCDLCAFYACPKRLDLSYDVNGDGSINGSELITDAEINQMMINFELRRQAIADANPRVFFDNSMGLTQYVYGYNGNGAGTTSAPTGAPTYTPGGDPNYPNDRDNFRLVDIPLWFDAPADPIHLTGGAYNYKVKNQLDHYMFESLRGLEEEPNHLTLWSEGNNDGYIDILENGVFNNGLRMGDEDYGFPGLNNDYRSILSFETGGLPNNAEVTGARIYIIRSSEEDNPFLHTDRNPIIDIKDGFFGTSANLELVDGTDGASLVDAGCYIGKATVNKYAIRIDLDPAALPYINNLGKTQFRLYFDYADYSDEYINFYDGAGQPGFAPPSQITRNNTLHYKNFTRIKTPRNNGGFDTKIEDESEVMIAPEGYVLEERVIDRQKDDDGVIIERVRTILAVEHNGLAQYMSNTYGAPGNGYAPFIDIAYTLVLPLELTTFEVTKENKDAHLSWTVQNATNFSHFELEKSNNGTNWSLLDKIEYLENENNYDYADTNLEPGQYYYRLKMIDISGAYQYSPIRNLRFENLTPHIEIYPNPFKDKLSIKYNINKSTDADLKILNVVGQTVFKKVIHIIKNGNQIDIGLGDLEAGIYLVQIIQDNQISSYKMIKE